MKSMEWLVYYCDWNKDKIEPINILGGSYVNSEIKKIKKKNKSIDEFATALMHEMKYHYWSRCEWELIIKISEDNKVYLLPWCGCKNPESAKIEVTDDFSFDWLGFAQEHISQQIYLKEAKIDVWDQLEYRWDDFVSYCWNTK